MGKLESEFKDLPEGFIALVLSDAEKLLETNVSILKVLTRKDHLGVYITVNQPYKKLAEILEKSKVDTSSMFFIDCISKAAGGVSKREKNVLYISSPSGLTELGIAISQVLATQPSRKKYIYMDALSTLVIYHTAGSIAKFSHFLMSKIKMLGLSGIFMAVNKEIDDKLIAQISQFCDKVFREVDIMDISESAE